MAGNGRAAAAANDVADAANATGSADAAEGPAVIRLGDLVARVGGELVSGDPDLALTGVDTLEDAGPRDVSFVTRSALAGRLRASGAGAALVGRDVELPTDLPAGLAVVRVDDAELAIADALQAFAPEPDRPGHGIHPSAVIDPSARVAAGVAVGPHVSVGPRSEIAPGTVLHPGCRIGADVVIGEGTELGSNVVIGDRCRIGRGCRLHGGVVIGADGFNYRPRPDGRGLRKIAHVGDVVIGDDVEIGACSCVDRGKFGSTRIGDGSKIDNLVQVGHNVVIGRSAVIVAGVMLGGSVRVGDGAQLAGQAAVRDHIAIGAGARVGGLSAVIRDVPDGGSVLGIPARDSGVELRQWAERLTLRRSTRE